MAIGGESWRVCENVNGVHYIERNEKWCSATSTNGFAYLSAPRLPEKHVSFHLYNRVGLRLWVAVRNQYVVNISTIKKKKELFFSGSWSVDQVM